MKKIYEKPEMHIEQFDAEDVITVSSGISPLQSGLQTVGHLMEQMVDMFDGFGQ